MLINVLKLSNTTFAPQTHTRTTSIATQTLSVLIISQQRDPNITKQGLDMQNFQAYGSSGSSLCNIWTSALEHNTPKVTHTHTHTKSIFQLGFLRKNGKVLKHHTNVPKVIAYSSKFVASRVRRMIKRWRWTDAGSKVKALQEVVWKTSFLASKEKVTHHKGDPGGLEADICGEVEDKVHLLSTNLTVLPCCIHPPAISATLKGVRRI